MDTNTVIAIAVVLILLIALGLIFLKSIAAKFLGVEIKAENHDPQRAGVDLKKVKAGRNLKAEDKVGDGVKAQNVKAKQDATFTNSKEGSRPNSKAPTKRGQ